MSLDKLTVSFSIEERNPNGRKTSAFYAATASRKSHLRGEDDGLGFTAEEAAIVKTFLSRHVVQETYDDAFRRKVLSPSTENLQERNTILAAYDQKLAHLVKKVDTEKPEPNE